MKKIVTVPNIISVIRLLLVPVIAGTYLSGHFVWAIALLAVSGLSDMLDGQIARHFGAISDLGKFLDPLADKLTTAVVVFCLMLRHPVMSIVMGALLIKELCLAVGAAILYRSGTRPSESKLWGKLSTALLYALMLLLVANDCASYMGYVLLPNVVFWILCALVCISLLLALGQYAMIFWAIRHGKYDVETESYENKTKSVGLHGRNTAAGSAPTNPRRD